MTKATKGNDFFNIYEHGFIRAAVCIPEVKVADVDFNVRATIRLARRAAAAHAVFALFPELGVSAYSNEDLFHQEALLRAVREGLGRIVASSRRLRPVIVVGAPLEAEGRLFNCGLVIHRGRILGVAVKSYLPNHREFHEHRHFTPAQEAVVAAIDLCGQEGVPFGADLIFTARNIPRCRFYLEFGEDLQVPVPPSSFAALAGATLIGNLSASHATVGKADYRRGLAANQSARGVVAYLSTAAGPGESTTDLAWDGHAMIHENGDMLAESVRFAPEEQIVFADIDLDRLAQERMRLTSFSRNARTHRDRVRAFRHIDFELEVPRGERILLAREYPRFPYVPADPARRDQRCREVFNIQVQGLAKRLRAAEIDNLVIGVSGGLDSTQALLVAARTMDALKRPRSNIKAYTMPGFATTETTYNNALRLMKVLGAEANELDIRPSCLQMFRDVGHPFAEGKPVYDITFENIQAGERTSHLFRLANMHQALVTGTGDLSELALGWCTYGVGDHMSHYNVNAGVPKTLIRRLIRWVADAALFSPETSAVLDDILETEISPELIPGADDTGPLNRAVTGVADVGGSDGLREGGMAGATGMGAQPAQKTEAVIGPFDLQDFHNYYITRFGYLPTKVAFLAYCAWRDVARGVWPDVPKEERRRYTMGEIKRWLEVYLYRFFKTSQFKRSCVPNGPKVGDGGALSPRGDYRAPSDSEAAVWLENLRLVPDED
ncbi:MAG: NAD(+) synthase [Pseudomonadota bacterium]|nr:NAD(+) synthase [Pseudomonadota bacterium]